MAENRLVLETVLNPKYSNAAGTRIDCDLKWVGVAEPWPFTADPNDSEAHGRQIYGLIVAGNFGPIAAYVPPPPPTAEQVAETARKEALKTETQGDLLIQTLSTATPEQVKTYIQNNVTDLASARQVLMRLGVAVAYLLLGSR